MTVSPPSKPLLEVIATSVEDGLAAQRGGADRLEVVSAMESDGLVPEEDLVYRLRDAVTLPLRVMLRLDSTFTAAPSTLDTLASTARRLNAAGVDGFVFGFLTPDTQLDLPALLTLSQAISPAPWTLHRAFDHLSDPAAAFTHCTTLPGLDCILTAGSPAGIDSGLHTLIAHAPWQTPQLRWLAGGGLRLEHVAPLRAAGITQFHSGRAVRHHQRWDAPVDEALVRQLKQALARPLDAPGYP